MFLDKKDVYLCFMVYLQNNRQVFRFVSRQQRLSAYVDISKVKNTTTTWYRGVVSSTWRMRMVLFNTQDVYNYGYLQNTRQLLHLCRDSKDSQCKLTLENIFHMNTSLCCRFLSSLLFHCHCCWCFSSEVVRTYIAGCNFRLQIVWLQFMYIWNTVVIAFRGRRLFTWRHFVDKIIYKTVVYEIVFCTKTTSCIFLEPSLFYFQRSN